MYSLFTSLSFIPISIISSSSFAHFSLCICGSCCYSLPTLFICCPLLLCVYLFAFRMKHLSTHKNKTNKSSLELKENARISKAFESDTHWLKCFFDSIFTHKKTKKKKRKNHRIITQTHCFIAHSLHTSIRRSFAF